MNVKNDISEELRSLSELVATISRQTPYRVADDYFADLSARVLLRIKSQHKPLTFNVPDGYFEGFAEGMMARIKAGAGKSAGQVPIQSAGLTPVQSAGLTPVQPVAESATDELSAPSPLLSQLRSLTTYRLPEGFFEELSPILAVAKELNPYTVPEQYFQQLPAEIEERLLEPQEAESHVGKSPIGKAPAKLVAFGSRRTNWWKYSAAAVVAGLILTIGWLRLHVTGRDRPGTSVDVTALAKVSDQELQSFLADQDTILAQPTNITASVDFNDNDVKSLLGEVPDGDLKQYLDEHGGPNDIATN